MKPNYTFRIKMSSKLKYMNYVHKMLKMKHIFRQIENQEVWFVNFVKIHDLLFAHLWEVVFEDISIKRRETASSSSPFSLIQTQKPFFLSSIMEARKLLKLTKTGWTISRLQIHLHTNKTIYNGDANFAHRKYHTYMCLPVFTTSEFTSKLMGYFETLNDLKGLLFLIELHASCLIIFLLEKCCKLPTLMILKCSNFNKGLYCKHILTSSWWQVSYGIASVKNWGYNSVVIVRSYE